MIADGATAVLRGVAGGEPGRTAAELDEREERTLAEAARAGDRASFDRLLREHVPRLRARMLAATGREDDADDLVQEVGVRALAAIGTFDGRSAFSTWLFAIGKHVAIDYIRRRLVRRAQTRTLGGGESGDDLPADPAPSPLARIVASERAAALEAALGRLPERHRRALIMRCVEGRTCAEIAEALGTTPNAASILIYRAKSELRELLEERAEEEGGRRDEG